MRCLVKGYVARSFLSKKGLNAFEVLPEDSKQVVTLYQSEKTFSRNYEIEISKTYAFDVTFFDDKESGMINSYDLFEVI